MDSILKYPRDGDGKLKCGERTMQEKNSTTSTWMDIIPQIFRGSGHVIVASKASSMTGKRCCDLVKWTCMEGP